MMFDCDNIGIAEEQASSKPHFQVHTTLLAMKSTGPKEAYITVSVGTVGEILDEPEKLNHPGFVKISVRGEELYTFARDLRDNTILEPLVCEIYA